MGVDQKKMEAAATTNVDQLANVLNKTERVYEDVRYPLSNYKGIWNSQKRITTSMHFWHMAHYYESSGKYAITSLRNMCVVFHLRAQESKELIILCTNLTVRLNYVSTLHIILLSRSCIGAR